MKSPTLFRSELFRFAVVGVVNTAFSYTVYSVLIYLGCNFALANLLALMVGILFSFKMQGALVFKNKENRRIVRFIVAWALIYFCNILLISRFINLGFSAYASGALAIPFSTILSYIAQKFFVFRRAAASM